MYLYAKELIATLFEIEKTERQLTKRFDHAFW